MDALVCNKVTKKFGGLMAVSSVDLQVKEASIQMEQVKPPFSIASQVFITLRKGKSSWTGITLPDTRRTVSPKEAFRGPIRISAFSRI